MDGAIIAEGTPTALALDRGFSGTGAAAQELTSTMKMYHAERHTQLVPLCWIGRAYSSIDSQPSGVVGTPPGQECDDPARYLVGLWMGRILPVHLYRTRAVFSLATRLSSEVGFQ